jgi:hypothetical protein
MKSLKIKRLSTDWNHPHRNASRTQVIFHNYGRGVVRSTWKEGCYMKYQEAIAQAESIPSWIEPNEKEALFELAKKVPKKNGQIVEVGSLYGGSTAFLGLGAPKAKITIFDDFSWQPLADVRNCQETLLDNLAKVELTNEIEIRAGDSRVTAKDWQGKIDLLWIDGGHSFEFVHSDLMNLGPSARVIACHDYDNPAWPTIRKAVEAFMGSHAEWHVDQVVGTLVTLRRTK